MRNIRVISTLSLWALIANAPCVYADSISSTNTSSTSVKDWRAWANQNLSVTFFSVYRGGSLSRLDYSLQPGLDGVPDPTSPQSTENYITAGYKLDKDTTVGVSSHFYYSPLGMPSAHGDSLMMLDPALMYSKSNWITWGNFKVKGMLYLTLPLSRFDYQRKHGLITAFAPTFNASYDIPQMNLTLALYGYVTAYFGGSASEDVHRTYKLYAAPNINYQFAKTVAATLWVDLIQASRMTQTHFIGGINNPTMDIEPGINWDITPNLSFNPMVNIYPSNPTMNASSFQAVLAGKLL